MRASRAPLPTDDGKSYATRGAKRTRGEGRCTRPAGCPGYGSCKWHAGNTPNGRRAAQLEQARDSLEGLGVPLVGTNPLDLLDDLIDQSAAIVAHLREQVAALPTVLSADGAHPLVRLYGQERDRAARVACEAVALGLEERRVRLDEATRDRLVRLFLAALAEPEHGLSKDQIEAAPRGLPAGGPSESIWPRAEGSPPAPESREVDVSTTQIPLTPDELLTTTRAVRRRIDLDRPVDREVVEEVLEIALQAPTASNMQPWSFVVVTEPDKKAAIAEWYRKSWAAYEEMPFAAANLPYDDPARKALQQRVMDSATYLAEHFERMPVFVIPCLGMRPEAIDLPASFVQATLYSSVIQAAWSLQLAARARGLGSCWTTLHLLYEREIGEILGIPYEVVQTGLLTLGHAKGTDFRPGPREPLETKVHWEAW